MTGLIRKILLSNIQLALEKDYAIFLILLVGVTYTLLNLSWSSFNFNRNYLETVSAYVIILVS